MAEIGRKGDRAHRFHGRIKPPHGPVVLTLVRRADPWVQPVKDQDDGDCHDDRDNDQQQQEPSDPVPGHPYVRHSSSPKHERRITPQRRGRL